jgi:5,5'-dehydrodivanillate O-demethylase oxygenase subunit
MVASDVRIAQDTRTEFVDIEHVGPGTPAGNWLRCFWQPFYRSEDLPAGRAKPVRLLGEDFTLYRGEGGQAFGIAFRCAHRGTQMSTGWVEGDTLRCFYHGWVYDGNGQCVEQPAEPEPFCNRIKLRKYPVREYAGIIFAYLGEGEPPPLPQFGIVDRANLREVETCVWPFSYRQALDNKQDLSHLPFVHRRTSDGGGAGRRPPTFPVQEVSEQAWGFTSTATYPSGLVATEHILMPNCYLHKDRPGNPRAWDPPMGWDDTIRWTVPIDDEHHMDVSLNLALATDEQIEEYHRRHAEALAAEPAPVMDLLKAVLDGKMTPAELAQYDLHGASGSLVDGVARWGQGTIPDRTQDHLGQSDAAPMLYRRLFEREISALAAGRPIKQWSWPLELHADWSAIEQV